MKGWTERGRGRSVGAHLSWRVKPSAWCRRRPPLTSFSPPLPVAPTRRVGTDPQSAFSVLRGGVRGSTRLDWAASVSSPPVSCVRLAEGGRCVSGTLSGVSAPLCAPLSSRCASCCLPPRVHAQPGLGLGRRRWTVLLLLVVVGRRLPQATAHSHPECCGGGGGLRGGPTRRRVVGGGEGRGGGSRPAQCCPPAAKTRTRSPPPHSDMSRPEKHSRSSV